MNLSEKDAPRFLLSVGILLLFGYAYVRNPSEQLLIGALIAMATAATQFWLGSSKGSSDKADQLERQASEPQRVQIDQPAGEPVPVEQAEPVPGVYREGQDR